MSDFIDQTLVDQLLSLDRHGLVWDGDLISKVDRQKLVELGFACRFPGGFNALTLRGQAVADRIREQKKG